MMVHKEMFGKAKNTTPASRANIQAEIYSPSLYHITITVIPEQQINKLVKIEP